MEEYCGYPKPLTPKTIEYAQTKNGTLRGFCQRGIYHFLGVQYGECERWRTATPVKPWRGVKNAVQFGNRAFPPGILLTPWDSCGVPHEIYPYSEDCLNLNIWTPTLDREAKKPIMVWIHGGGYASGCVMEMQAHDGEETARFGDVVMVGVNHRLNVFGFLDMSGFGEKYANSGNCGLSDLVLALRWIRDNITAFGGDPDNVTIFGQSGGGGKVRALMQTPAADGLYHKAIVMSGARMCDEAEDDSFSRFVIGNIQRALGSDRVEDMEALTPEELLDIIETFLPTTGGPPEGAYWGPVRNDWYLGKAVNVGFTEYGKKVPVMIGSTYAEMPPVTIKNKNELTDLQGRRAVRDTFPGQDVEELLRIFAKTYPDRHIVDAALVADSGYHRQGDLEFADLRYRTCSAPTYNYLITCEFEWEGGRPAWHCVDIPMVFHNSAHYPKKFNSVVLDGLEDAVCSSWVNFAHFGDPNNDRLGVKWPEYRSDARATLIFDKNIEVREGFDDELNDCYRNLKIVRRKTGQLIN